MKQAKLYQYNSGEYTKLDKLKDTYLKDSSSLNMLVETRVLDLSD